MGNFPRESSAKLELLKILSGRKNFTWEDLSRMAEAVFPTYMKNNQKLILKNKVFPTESKEQKKSHRI